MYQGYGNRTLDSAVRLRPQHDTGFPEGRIHYRSFTRQDSKGLLIPKVAYLTSGALIYPRHFQVASTSPTVANRFALSGAD